jgi:acyl-coenzyme A synthetase/AMP-(fatty) acid ligase
MKIIDLKTSELISKLEVCEYVNAPARITNSVIYSDFLSFQLHLIKASVFCSKVLISDRGISPAQVESLNIEPHSLSLNGIQKGLLSNNNLRYTLQSSGTTGEPKTVHQEFSNLLRYIKIDPKYESAKWLSTFSPSHISGLQVFFQSFLNSSIFYSGFEAHPQDICATIASEKISNISWTPTSFLNALPYLKPPFPSVRTVTFGGEKLTPNVLNLSKSIFSGATIKNIYASTEFGSLLDSSDVSFKIKKELNQLVKIENSEIHVHKSLCADFGYEFKEEWYPTGDLVSSLGGEEFIVIGRKSETFNVGGYNVSPSEIEAIIGELPFIQAVKVYGRRNSVLGKIVCADVMISASILAEECSAKFIQEIKDVCKKHLPDWKIPRIIKIVPELNVSRTGKHKTNE